MRIYSKVARGLCAAPWGLFVLSALVGIFDPTSGPDQPVGPVLQLVAAGALLIRSLRLGLTIDESRLTSRGILRTRHLPRDVITQIQETRYRGMAFGNTPSGWWRMLRVRSDERWVNLPHTMGAPRALRLLEAQAALALGLPEREPSH